MNRLAFSRFPLRVTLLLSACLVAVAGCSSMMRPQSEEDVQRILDEMKGPEVPGLKEALVNGAKQAEDAGEYAKAAQFYQQLMEKEPENEAHRFAYAESLRKAGAYEAAVETYDTLEDSEELRIPALEGAGLALMAEGEFDDAGDRLADVMEADTTRWRTINAIGILFTIKQMYPEARQYFAEALAQAPKSIAVHNNMGLMEALAEEYDESIRLLREAGDIAGKSNEQAKVQTDMNLALVYAIKGDLDRAEAVASRHLDESKLLNNMGYYAHLADDDQLAKSYLNMALTSSDRHYEKAWQNLETLDKLINNAPRRR